MTNANVIGTTLDRHSINILLYMHHQTAALEIILSLLETLKTVVFFKTLKEVSYT